MATRTRFGFTLIEVLVSSVVISLLVMMLASMTNQTAQTWKFTAGKIEQFTSARDGFESLTRQLAQSTLNTYYDYFDAAGQPRTPANASTFVPVNYGRQSELRFICGSMDRSNLYRGNSEAALAADPSRPRPTHGVFFHAPLGFVDDSTRHGSLSSLLNCWGYYVEFDSDNRQRPPFLTNAAAPARWRYRLMEFMQPSEDMNTYRQPDHWFEQAVNEANTPRAHVLAENVVALVLQPELSPADEKELSSPPSVEGTALAPSYFYDSTKSHTDPALNPKHQLPPNVRVTMVAIDETSALRIAHGSAMPDFGLSQLFQTNGSSTADSYAQDLAKLEKTLTDQHCSYRVFTTTVAIQGAKWSKQ